MIVPSEKAIPPQPGVETSPPVHPLLVCRYCGKPFEKANDAVAARWLSASTGFFYETGPFHQACVSAENVLKE